VLTARDPQALAGERYDLVIIGGGIYGIMVALEAARRRLRPILIERDDFAAATSANSLGIIHGGLRYLQGLDLSRFRASVAERRWFLRHFPDLARPLPCLMPLYGDGARRPWLLRAALAFNDALSHSRNRGVGEGRMLPAGRVLDGAAVRARFPGVDRDGLRGAALWHDGFVPNLPRLPIETLRWACAWGARALNYVAARDLLLEAGRVAGVRAIDGLSGADLSFRAPVVVNAAGPWVPAFAASCGAEAPRMMQPSLAWNVAFERAPSADCALAVTPRPGAQTYFLVPWKGILLAGTGHAPWHGGPDDPLVPSDLLGRFIADLNAAVPGLDLEDGDVGRVFAGLLPARWAGTAELTVREVIVDHGRGGGPAGLYSLGGIKLTTARRGADKVLTQAFPAVRPIPYSDFARPAGGATHPDYPYAWMPAPGDNSWREPLARARTEEAVEHLDDLLLRRSSLGDSPRRASVLAAEAAKLFAWDAPRATREVAALRRGLGLASTTRQSGEDQSRDPPGSGRT
jgi:glycerol-3-phosphate dehydrogenase